MGGRFLSRTSTPFYAFVAVVSFLLAMSGAQTHQTQNLQPPEGMLTAGLRETARHRAPLPELRIGRTEGGPQNVTFWVHVDDQGNVIEVRGFTTDAPWPLKYSTNTLPTLFSKSPTNHLFAKVYPLRHGCRTR